MRRSDREQDQAFSYAVIDQCTHGVMALSTGEPVPYCLPLSFVRLEDDLFFHCSKEGRKIDLLRRSPKVCVTFVGQDRPAFISPAMYTTYYQSAIVTGTASEVENFDEKIQILRALCQKVTPEHMDGFSAITRRSLDATAVWKIHMEEVSGKAKQ